MYVIINLPTDEPEEARQCIEVFQLVRALWGKEKRRLHIAEEAGKKEGEAEEEDEEEEEEERKQEQGDEEMECKWRGERAMILNPGHSYLPTYIVLVWLLIIMIFLCLLLI